MATATVDNRPESNRNGQPAGQTGQGQTSQVNQQGLAKVANHQTLSGVTA